MKKIFLFILVLSTFGFQHSFAAESQICANPSTKNIEFYGKNLGSSTKNALDIKLEGLIYTVEQKYANIHTQQSIYRQVIQRIHVLEKQQSVIQNVRMRNILHYIEEKLLYRIASISINEQCVLDNLLNIDNQNIETDQNNQVGSIRIQFDNSRKITWNKISGAKKYNIQIGTHRAVTSTNSYTIPKNIDIGNYNGDLSDVFIKAYNRDGDILAIGEIEISYQGNHCHYQDENMSTDVYHNQRNYSSRSKNIYGGTLSYRKNFVCEFGEIIFLADSNITVSCDNGYYGKNEKCIKEQTTSSQGNSCSYSGQSMKDGSSGGGQEIFPVNHGKKIMFVDYFCSNGNLIVTKKTLQRISCNSGYSEENGLCKKNDPSARNCVFTNSDTTTALNHKEKRWLIKDVNIQNGIEHTTSLIVCSDGVTKVERELSSYTSCDRGYYNKNRACYKTSDTKKKLLFSGPSKVLAGKPFTVEWATTGYKYCIPYGEDLKVTTGGNWNNSTDLGNTTSIQGYYSAHGSISLMPSSQVGARHSLGLQCYIDKWNSDHKKIIIQTVGSLSENTVGLSLKNKFVGVGDNTAAIEFFVDIDSDIVENVEILELVTSNGINKKNDDNRGVSFPETIQNGDEWYLTGVTPGLKKITSYTYKINFKQDSSRVTQRESITKTENVNIDLGTYGVPQEDQSNVSIYINEMFGLEKKDVRVGFAIDIDPNSRDIVDHVEIIDFKTTDGITIRNDDNAAFNFPERIQNGDEWFLKADTIGDKIIESFTYKIVFKQGEGRNSIVKTEEIIMSIGEYREDEVAVVEPNISISVDDIFGNTKRYARIKFSITDLDYDIVERVEIIDIETTDGISIRNDDNNDFNFPERIQNGDDWQFRATTTGIKKIESFTYKITFQQDGGSTTWRDPIIKKKEINMELGEYSDD